VHERPRLAFWAHQATELLAGVLLVVQALTSSRPAVPMAAGLVLVALAVTADGPVGVAHWVSRPWHRALDAVAVVALVAAAVTVAEDDFGRILLFAAAGVLAVLLWRTDYRRPQARRRDEPEPEAPSSGERYGRAAGRAMGAGIAAWRKKPPAP